MDREKPSLMSFQTKRSKIKTDENLFNPSEEWTRTQKRKRHDYKMHKSIWKIVGKTLSN
jgi:hypothetical protein